jgi:5-oxoprolinase (ATP-hydrolysing) subunit A
MTVVVNCDMGEGFGMWRLADDEALMPHIDLANVACGFHAGDPLVMSETVASAARHGVKVGAHPAYPDLQGFGRRAMDMTPAELTAAVVYQVGALRGFLDAAGLTLHHIKPHGALYGRAARDEAVAHAVADAVEVFGVPVLGMAGTMHQTVYEQRGLQLLVEYYADLEYADDGGLLITRRHAAYDPAEVRDRVLRVLGEERAVTASGSLIPMRADCICVHSDTPNAVEVARAVRHAIARSHEARGAAGG